MRKTISMLKQESGVALMMAIASVTLLMIIATEVMYETGVELVVSSQAVNQLKAHYAAKAGVQLSLLRIHAYKKAASLAGDKIPASMLDPIWQMPFAWPPVVGENVSAVEKGEIQSAVKESKMQGTYFVTIQSEGGKLDINDLASPSKVIAASTRQQLLQMLTTKMESDDAFADKNRGVEFSTIVDNITDWVDDDKTQKGGRGDESSLYPSRGPNDVMPPNAPFKTLEELHMVAGMTDDLYDLLAPRLTVFGTKGINVNYASKDVLMSLSPQITDERAGRIIEDRAKPDRGPFKSEEDFVQYLGTIGITGNPFQGEKEEDKVPLLYGPEFNFRIISTGRAGRVQREITAVTFDLSRVRSQLKSQLPKPSPSPTPPGDPSLPPQPTPTPTPASTKAAPVPNEQPNIVYWNER